MTVATKLHVLTEIAGAEPLVARMGQAAHYAIGDDVVAMLARNDVQQSILAMIEAGIARLPYSPLLIEFSATGSPARRFVLLTEAADGGFHAEIAALYRETMVDLSPSRMVVGLTSAGLSVQRPGSDVEGAAAGFAAAIALLMLNIRGIEKQVVETDRLNRARARHGKPAIPRHTIVRIGTIYDRAGRGVSASGRGPMPVHLRAGHTRQQACGPDHSERRPVFIAPVLVNYRDGADMPAVPKRVVRA